MHIPDNLKYLLKEQGAKRWLTRSRQPRGNAIFPTTYSDRPVSGSTDYIYSDDPRFLRLTEKLATRLTAEFPATTTVEGFAGSNGVPSDFYTLLNVSGYGMDPLPIPVRDNAKLIEGSGLAQTIIPRDVPWLKELIRLFFGHVTPASLHIRKQASTSFPYFTSDIQYKKLSTLKILRSVDHFLDLATGSKRELEQLLREYDVTILYAIGERQQPNAIIRDSDGNFRSKDRIAPTEAEARSGTFDGGTKADMSVTTQDGRQIKGHFAMRRRDVFAMCGPLNYALTAIFNPFREVYLNRFEFTYKTRDRLDKRQKISKYTYVVGSDVKTMDKMVPRWFLDFLCDELTNYIDDRVCLLLRRMLAAPYVCPPPWRKTEENYNPFFGGDPCDHTSFDGSCGLPSGIFINPDIGKLWMTFVYVTSLRDIGALVTPSELEQFLQGRNPQHALLDMSDDAAFLTNSKVVAEKLVKLTSPYAILEPEQPVIYLGDVFTRTSDGVDAYPNPVTFVVNALCREDSIDRSPIGNYADGVLARHHVYSHSPIFRDLNAIYEEEVRAHLGINPTLMARALSQATRLTDVDALVRLNPGAIHYKVDPKDVSPMVLDELVATIPSVDFFQHVRHLYKVPVQ